MKKILNPKEIAICFLNEIHKNYWTVLYNYMQQNSIKMNRMINLLLNFQKIVVSIGYTHIAIEYYEKENCIDSDKQLSFLDNFNMKCFDYRQSKNDNLFENVIGIKFNPTNNINIPIYGVVQDLICPTNDGQEKLDELGWIYETQDGIIAFNSGYIIPKNEFCRILNCTFFDNNNSGLITRRAKVIDFFPIIYDASNKDYDLISIDIKTYAEKLYLADLSYKFPEPEFYEQEKVSIVNRFIELYGNKNTSEPEITKFLSRKENEYILKCRFSAQNIFSQKVCEWQSEEKPAIQPDFFVLNANGYADIVEFKLPDLKNNPVVGKTNRETFSAEIQSYISQTRVYQSYFDDPNNRKWVEKEYGFKVYKPKRFLVVGRRFDFSSDEWQEIKSDYNNLEILTYDDLIDGVIAPLFC